jgi:translocation and assembly module TamB
MEPQDPEQLPQTEPAQTLLTRTQRVVRYGAWILAGLGLVFMLALGGLWYWSAGTQSLGTLLQIVQRNMPAGSSLQIEGVSGTVRHGGHIGKLVYRLGDAQADESAGALTLSFENIDLAWDWTALWDRSTRLQALHVRKVTLADTRAARADTASTPLQELVLPVGIDAPFMVDAFDIVSGAGQIRTLKDLRGRYRYERILARHHLAIDTVRDDQGSYTLQAALGGAAPMPLEFTLDGQLVLSGREGVSAQTLQLDLKGEGTLSGADASLKLTGAARPVQAAADAASAAVAADVSEALLQLQATVRPWQRQVLSAANVQWKAIDLRAFWPQAPHTRLHGALQLQPQTGATVAPDHTTAAPEKPVDGLLGVLGPGRWQGQLQMDNAEAGPLDQQRLPLHVLRSELQYENGALHLNALDWQLAAQGGGHITGQAQYQATQGWNGQISLQQLDLAAIHSAVQAEPLQGTVNARSTLSPGQSLQEAPLQFEAAIQSVPGRDSSLLRFDAITLQGRWHEQVAQLSTILVRSRGGTLQGQARYEVTEQSAQADLKLQLPGGSGLLKGQLASDSGLGQLQLDLRNLRQAGQWLRQWPGMQFLRARALEGSARLQAGWRGGWQDNGRDMRVDASLNVPSATVRQAADAAPIVLRDVGLMLQGRLADARVEAKGRMQQGSRTLHLEMRGSGGKRAKGWQANLQALQAQVHDTLQKRQWQAVLSAPVPVEVEQANDRLRLQTGAFEIALRGDAAAKTASIRGEPLQWLRQGNGYTVSSQGRIHSLPLIWLQALSGADARDQSISGDMVLDGDWDVELGQRLRVQASLARSSGDVVILAGGVSGRDQGRVAAGTRTARIDITGAEGDVHARLSWDSVHAGSASATLRTQLQRAASGWTLPANAPLQGQLRAQLPRVGVWNVFAPPGWRLRGTLDANIAISGTLQSPQLQGALDANDLGVRSVVDGIAFSGGRLRARFNGQRMDIDTFSLQGAPWRTGLLGTQRAGGGSVNVSGSVQWGGGQPLLESARMQLAGTFDQLQLFTMPDRQMVLSGALNASFSSKQLTVRGGLQVNRALIELSGGNAPELGNDVVIRPSMKNPRATLAQSAWQSRAANAAPDSPKLGDDIVVQARPATPASTAQGVRTTGAATSQPVRSRSRATVPADTRQTIRTAGATSETNTSSGIAMRPNPAIGADIQVGIDLGSDFRVRGSGLDTRITGRLTVQGGPTIRDMPRLVGTVNTDLGTFRAYGQDLQIESGRIAFAGAPGNPSIDIVAVRRNINVRVGVRLYGTAQQPLVKLFSEPAMPDSERRRRSSMDRTSAS